MSQPDMILHGENLEITAMSLNTIDFKLIKIYN